MVDCSAHQRQSRLELEIEDRALSHPFDPQTRKSLDLVSQIEIPSHQTYPSKDKRLKEFAIKQQQILGKFIWKKHVYE